MKTDSLRQNSKLTVLTQNNMEKITNEYLTLQASRLDITMFQKSYSTVVFVEGIMTLYGASQSEQMFCISCHCVALPSAHPLCVSH